MTTIRDEIQRYAILLRNADTLTPHMASGYLVELTSYLASVNAEISKRLFALNQKKVELLEAHKTSSEAKMRAEATPEYQAWHEAHMQGKALEETLRSIKVFVRTASEEMKLQ